MSKLSVEEYQSQQANCENLCAITDDKFVQNVNIMRCVTCPFCKEIVNAIVTDATIACPACEVVVRR